MSIWKVTPSDNVTGSNGTYTFPKNTGTTDMIYTVSYTSDTNCTASTTYIVPSGTTCRPTTPPEIYQNYYFCMNEIGEGARTIKKLSRTFAYNFVTAVEGGVKSGNLQFDELFASNDTNPSCSSGIRVFPDVDMKKVTLNELTVEYMTDGSSVRNTNLKIIKKGDNTIDLAYTGNNVVVFSISKNGMDYNYPGSYLNQTLDIVWYFKINGLTSDLYYKFQAQF